MGLPITLTNPAIAGLVKVSNYYDRQPVIQNFYNNNAYAPHGVTNRVTYTVPTNKGAYIEFWSLTQVRQTAATTPGQSQIYFSYFGIQSGITNAPGYSQMNTNTLFAMDRVVGGNFGLMVTGDQVFLSDGDTSTGGTVAFIESLKVTEFGSI